MARTRTFYTDSAKAPSVNIESVKGGPKNLWKIQVPVGEDLRGARPGLSLEQHAPDKYLQEVKGDVPFKSNRPDWLSLQTAAAPTLHACRSAGRAALPRTRRC